MDNVEQWWDAHYSNCPPIGHILRSYWSCQWLRIHSLPDSKRYAHTRGEHATLLKRHNEVATEILGLNSPCVIFAVRFAPTEKVKSNSVKPRVARLQFTLFRSQEWPALDSHETYDEDLAMSIWHADSVWSPGKFDDLINAIASWKVVYLLFASPETGEVYAPYDGGADLFLSSSGRRDELKVRYGEWLSDHPLGL